MYPTYCIPSTGSDMEISVEPLFSDVSNFGCTFTQVKMCTVVTITAVVLFGQHSPE